MPVIKVIGRLKIQMYADDHYPPHFQSSPDFEVLVGISGLSILKGERYRRDIAEALDWASANVGV